MNINIGFDADGVLFDTESFQLSKEVSTYMKQKYNLDIVNENGYGIKDVYGCSKKIELKCWTHFIMKYSLIFKERDCVRETICKLRKENNKVYIITSKACALEKSFRGIAVRIIFELGLMIKGIYVDGIEYCSLENSAEDKMKACEKRKIQIFVEDKKENVEYISSKIPVLCMDTKNNQGVDGINIIRVNDFNDLYAEIHAFFTSKTNRNDSVRFKTKSKEEKMNMSLLQKTEYYKQMEKYYENLPFDRKRIDRGERKIRIMSFFFSFYFKNKYKPQIVGIENLPKEKGVIYVCNHRCSKDMLLLLYAIHTKDTQWHPLIKHEILNEKVGILFRMGVSVFVDRRSLKSRHLATQEMAKLLVNGYNILIFPEGTYNRTENDLKEFEGASHVYLSQMLKKTIVPCALTSDYKLGPKLRFGKPYVVPISVSIQDALEDSYQKLAELVKENK